MEAAGLGIFMISAGVFATLLEYPQSPVHQLISNSLFRRFLIGCAMGLTAAAIIVSFLIYLGFNAPAIEFLEYLAPRDGRPYPVDSKANDIWHWQIHLITANPNDAFGALRAGKTTFVSSGPVTLPNKNLGFNKGLLIRDPDGHALL